MVKLHSSGPRPTVDLSLSPEFPPMGTLGVFLTPLPEESVSLLKGGSSPGSVASEAASRAESPSSPPGCAPRPSLGGALEATPPYPPQAPAYPDSTLGRELDSIRIQSAERVARAPRAPDPVPVEGPLAGDPAAGTETSEQKVSPLDSTLTRNPPGSQHKIAQGATLATLPRYHKPK